MCSWIYLVHGSTRKGTEEMKFAIISAETDASINNLVKCAVRATIIRTCLNENNCIKSDVREGALKNVKYIIDF